MASSTEKLWVWSGLHGGVEPTAGEVVDYLEAHPLDGVFTSRFHPEAEAAGVRHLGPLEAGSQFGIAAVDADPATLNPEQLAAWRSTINVVDGVYPDYWAGIDIHTSPSAEANSLYMGNRTSRILLGLGPVLGLSDVIVMPEYPFFNKKRRFISVETTLDRQNNPLSQPEVWHKKLAIIAQLGAAGLAALARQTMHHNTYYRQVEIMRLHPDGTVDHEAVEEISGLEQMTHPGSYFKPLDLDAGWRRRLGLDEEEVFSGGMWDENNSAAMPEVLGYRADGKPRRACFGTLMVKLNDWPQMPHRLRMADYLGGRELTKYRSAQRDGFKQFNELVEAA